MQHRVTYFEMDCDGYQVLHGIDAVAVVAFAWRAGALFVYLNGGQRRKIPDEVVVRVAAELGIPFETEVGRLSSAIPEGA